MPQHIAFLLNRAYFYFVGDDGVDVLGLTKEAIHELAQGAQQTLATTTAMEVGTTLVNEIIEESFGAATGADGLERAKVEL